MRSFPYVLHPSRQRCWQPSNAAGQKEPLQSQLLLCAAWPPVMSQHSSFGATATSAFRAASAAGVGDTLCPQLLSLTFATLPVFAPAGDSRVLHSGAVCEPPAEDPGPCSHHCVSEAQAKPTLTASPQPWVEGMKVRKESSATPSSAAATQTFGPAGTTVQPHM